MTRALGFKSSAKCFKNAYILKMTTPARDTTPNAYPNVYPTLPLNNGDTKKLKRWIYARYDT